MPGIAEKVAALRYEAHINKVNANLQDLYEMREILRIFTKDIG